MLDPFAIVRAVGTFGAAVVVGSGVLIWYTRDALVPAGGSIWRRRVVLSVLVAALVSAAATVAGVIGAAAAAAEIGAFSVDGTIIGTFLLHTGVGRITIVEIALGAAACVPAIIAWLTLKNPKVSDVALLVAALIAAAGLATVPFASHPTTLDQQILGIGAAIAHRWALSVWLGGFSVTFDLMVTPEPATMRYGDPQASAPVSTSSAQYEVGKPDDAGAIANGV